MEPKKLKKTKSTDGIHYSYKWRGGFLNIFSMIFSGFFTFSIGYSMREILTNPPALLFSLIFLSVAISVFYAQVCVFINKTQFHLTSTTLVISSSPLPWPKSNKTINTGDIKDILTQEYRSGRGGKQITTNIIHSNGKKETIFTRWNNQKDPDYFAEEIREYLSLNNQQERF